MPIVIYKPIGETPLGLIENLKESKKFKKNQKLSFAGRLDPMAHGKMIILVDNECKLQPNFCNLKKKYKFTILKGVQTDTYDILGLIDYNNTYCNSLFKLEIGDFDCEYPPYSSIVVNKKPLWWWAKNKLINQVKIPSKICTIYKYILEENKSITSETLKTLIFKKLNMLKSEYRENFRFDEILNNWNVFFENNKSNSFTIQNIEIDVSSGTYIRNICNKMGGLALDIERLEFLD